MPGFDGTGPQGLGPMTGGGRGYCVVPLSGIEARPFAFRRGFFGRGGGRGWRHWYYATGLPGWVRPAYGYPAFGGLAYPYAPKLTPKEEMDVLREQSEILRQQLEDIQNRINALEKAAKESE